MDRHHYKKFKVGNRIGVEDSPDLNGTVTKSLYRGRDGNYIGVQWDGVDHESCWRCEGPATLLHLDDPKRSQMKLPLRGGRINEARVPDGGVYNRRKFKIGERARVRLGGNDHDDWVTIKSKPFEVPGDNYRRITIKYDRNTYTNNFWLDSPCILRKAHEEYREPHPHLGLQGGRMRDGDFDEGVISFRDFIFEAPKTNGVDPKKWKKGDYVSLNPEQFPDIYFDQQVNNAGVQSGRVVAPYDDASRTMAIQWDHLNHPCGFLMHSRLGQALRRGLKAAHPRLKLKGGKMNEEKEGPVHDHDCTRCKFLGTDSPRHSNERGCNAVDMYACQGPKDLTLIRRYGSEGSRYSSMDHRYAKQEKWAPLFAKLGMEQPK